MDKLFKTLGKAFGTPENYTCDETDPTWVETFSYFGDFLKKYGFEIIIGMTAIGLLEYVIL